LSLLRHDSHHSEEAQHCDIESIPSDVPTRRDRHDLRLQRDSAPLESSLGVEEPLLSESESSASDLLSTGSFGPSIRNLVGVCGATEVVTTPFLLANLIFESGLKRAQSSQPGVSLEIVEVLDFWRAIGTD